MRLFGYTNPRGVGFHVPEFATFQDEWLRYGWFNRNWGAGRGRGLRRQPVPQLPGLRPVVLPRDAALLRRRVLGQHVPERHFDPVVGEAWTDEQGRVHPTPGPDAPPRAGQADGDHAVAGDEGPAGIRRPPITLSHMTNTLIVPVHSFINCTMDWEWKYGYEDFQDRFSPDLTVAETIGRQVGCWPTILAGGHPDPKDPRVPISCTARGWAWPWSMRSRCSTTSRPRDAEIYRQLFEFGYGTDRCRVFNYWQDGHPVARRRASRHGRWP